MSEFVDYLHEVFEQFGHIHVRKMFGGYGVYHNDIMFGLISDDTLYLKADHTTAKHFESRGLNQFEYDKRGKPVKMSYYEAPAEILDDPEDAAVWARRSYDIAMRAKPRTKKTANK